MFLFVLLQTTIPTKILWIFFGNLPTMKKMSLKIYSKAMHIVKRLVNWPDFLKESHLELKPKSWVCVNFTQKYIFSNVYHYLKYDLLHFFKDGIGKVIAFKIDEFLQTGIFSTITTNKDLRNDQDKTLAKERKNGLKNLPDKDDFVASNAIDSHLTGNPNYDPDTVNQNYQKNLI